MTHKLKILPEFFAPVVKGDKTFEIRKNDRNFKVGDLVRLLEYNPETQRYSGQHCLVYITYILNSKEFCKPGFIVFSFVKL